MYQFIVVLAVIVAILLAAIVLIQESKGGGLASSVAGANSVLGVRKTTDFVEKATWTLAGILVVLSIASSFFVNRGTVTADDLVNNMKTTAPAPQLPGQAPADGQAAPAAEAPAEAPAK
ncbi:MAG: preprotein translocase subunit SecG [Bacteroidales bacterium]|nr:preprotein translocase subunit SecG [Bacteroidales bacterium]